MTLALNGSAAVAVRTGFWGEEEAPTQVLPSESLLQIFSLLPNPGDVLSSALVCRRWAEVGSDWSLPQALANKFEWVRAYWIAHGEATRQILCRPQDFWHFREGASSHFVAMQKYEEDINYVLPGIPRVYRCNRQTSHEESVIETSLPIGFSPQLIKNEKFLVIYSPERAYITVQELSTGTLFPVYDDTRELTTTAVCNEKWLVVAFTCQGICMLSAMLFRDISQGQNITRVIESLPGHLPCFNMALSHGNTLFVSLESCIKSYDLDSPDFTQGLILLERSFPLLFSPKGSQECFATKIVIKGGKVCAAQVESPLDNAIMSPEINIKDYKDIHVEQVGKIFIISTSRETVIWDLADSFNIRRLPAPRKQVLFTEVKGLTFLRGTSDGVVEKWDFRRPIRRPLEPRATRSASKRKRASSLSLEE